MAIKYNFTMSADDIEAGITSASKRLASVKANIHCLAVSVIYRWATDRAANVAAAQATEMLKAFPDFGQQIVNWFAVYGKLELTDEGVFRYTETTVDADTFQKAKAETMFDLTPPAAPKPAFDFKAQLASLIQKAEKRKHAVEEGKAVNEDDDIDEALLNAAKALF